MFLLLVFFLLSLVLVRKLEILRVFWIRKFCKEVEVGWGGGAMGREYGVIFRV